MTRHTTSVKNVSSPTSLSSISSAMTDIPEALAAKGIRARHVDHSIHFEMMQSDRHHPLLSVWFNVESRQYTMMGRSSIIRPGRPMSRTNARLAEHLALRARQHGWRDAAQR